MHAAQSPGLRQLRHLVQSEAEALSGPDHPKHRHRLGPVHAVPAKTSIRLLQKPAAFVVAQRLKIDTRSVGHLTRPQGGAHADPPAAISPRAVNESSTPTFAAGVETSRTALHPRPSR